MPNDDSRLGRGLSAIFGDIDNEEDKIENISLDLIVKNKNQPRSSFDEKSLYELTKSIKEKGVLQPILVREQGEKYEIIAGERRFLAAKMAQMTYIPAIIKDINDKESAEIALIENLQRENLNPVEEALAYKGLMEKFGYTQEEVAKKVGKDRATVSNAIRLLSLPKEITNMLKNGDISAGHARALLALQDKDSQKELAKLIKNKKISVRETEERVRNAKSSVEYKYSQYEEKLKAIFKNAKIKVKNKKGIIEIHFNNEDELQSIFKRWSL